VDGRIAVEHQIATASDRGRIAELLKPTACRSISPAPVSGAVAGRAVRGGAMMQLKSSLAGFFSYRYREHSYCLDKKVEKPDPTTVSYV
jgi:hypothetical protein